MMIRRNIFGYLLLALCGVLCSPAYAQLSTDGAVQISKIQRGVDFEAPNGACREPVVPPEGDFVVFSGKFKNFQEFDQNNSSESSNIFLYKDGEVKLLSANTSGKAPFKFADPSNGETINLAYGSYAPAVSKVLGNSQYAVAFTSDAIDLISTYFCPTSNRGRQVFVRFSSWEPKLISRVGGGGSGASCANGDSDQPTIAVIDDSQNTPKFRVCYRSNAGDLLPSGAGPKLDHREVYCVDIDKKGEFLGSPRRIAQATLGPNEDMDEPVLSADGSTLAFSAISSMDGGPRPISRQIYKYLFTPTGGTLLLVSKSEERVVALGHSSSPSISSDGKIIAFTHDGSSAGALGSTLKGFEGNHNKIFVRYDSGSTTPFSQVNVGNNGNPSDGVSFGGVIDASGRYAAFFDTGKNLILGTQQDNLTGYQQAYIRDLQLEYTVRASVKLNFHREANGDSNVADKTYLNRAISLGKVKGQDSKLVVTFNSKAANLKADGLLSDVGSHPFVYASDFTIDGNQPTATPTSTPTPTPSPTDTSEPTASPTPTSFTTGEVDSGTPIPLTNNVEIPDPPEVQVTQSNSDGTFDILILLKRFTLAKSASGKALFIGQASGKQGKITYQIELTKDGSKKRIQRVLSRNMTTIRKLTPGRYTLRYKVVATKGNKRIQSRMSPAKTFTLG